MVSQVCGFLDAKVTMKGHPMEEKIRDAIQLQACDDPKEHLKLYIGVSGIQYYGVNAPDTMLIFLLIFDDSFNYFRLECLTKPKPRDPFFWIRNF